MSNLTGQIEQIPHFNHFGKLIAEDTDQLFTEAVNASFPAVAEHTAKTIQEMYTIYGAQLPFDCNAMPGPDAIDEYPLTSSAVIALNAIHRLVNARRCNLAALSLDDRIASMCEALYVAPAIHEVIQSVCLAQQHIAGIPGSKYINTSFAASAVEQVVPKAAAPSDRKGLGWILAITLEKAKRFKIGRTAQSIS